MSARVRPAVDADIEPVADLLHRLMNPKIPRERWRRVLDYPWRPPEAERGWLVEDAGAVVGFMATIYSDRETSVGLRRFCDLGAWYLERDYRGTGIGDELLRAGMAQLGVTYATMTARRATGRRIRALGFTVLDATRRIFRAEAGRPGLALRPVDEARLDEARLDARSRRIVRDHRRLNVEMRTAGDPASPVLFVFQSKRKGADILYRELLFCSDRGFLAAEAGALAQTLCRDVSEILAVDSRFLPANFMEGEREEIALPRWVRTPDVPVADVDHLYAETLLLDLKLP
ncbi:GNAT family N-acetyltransferase [Aureimonas pseudogalii]|uniref:GNAT superfamily N-acetyltransferase n=1 Tax=Aureimonas pseudogalii TaxID=1744844 RepID=A0A7W6E7Y1_9HYPH|nr:GNAT family N-acetyltransferase [Aureimonas pseudogalii]MBB3996368.1 GNAT superfamily N-acetyltransferase [Aureimonas pseudogalii]